MDDEAWARVRGLVGAALKTPRGGWFRVTAVGGSDLAVRAAGRSGAIRISRRRLGEAAGFVAAGRRLPVGLRERARMAAILRAAGLLDDAGAVLPGAEQLGGVDEGHGRG